MTGSTEDQRAWTKQLNNAKKFVASQLKKLNPSPKGGLLFGKNKKKAASSERMLQRRDSRQLVVVPEHVTAANEIVLTIHRLRGVDLEEREGSTCAFNVCLGNLSRWTKFQQATSAGPSSKEFHFEETIVLRELDLIDNADKPLLWWQQTLTVQM